MTKKSKLALAGLSSVLALPIALADTPSSPNATQRQVFNAQLNPVNPSISSAKANARIIIEGNRAGIYIQGSGLSPQTVHMQHIHLGTSCPTSAADKNTDGIVDALEASAVAGPSVVPLSLNPVRSIVEGIIAPGTPPPSPTGPREEPREEPPARDLGNISTHSAYPFAAQDGSFNYIASIPVNALQRAFSQHGTPEETPVSLEKKVIIIHGVAANTQLPNTVKGLPGVSATESLPVICGQIVKSSE